MKLLGSTARVHLAAVALGIFKFVETMHFRWYRWM